MKFTKEPFLASVVFFSIPFFAGMAIMNTHIFTKSIDVDSWTNPLNNAVITPTEITFSTKHILENNIKVVLLLCLGALTLGLPTFFYLIYNGILHGTFIGLLSDGTSTKDILILYIPHGIFELPAIWLAGAAGLKGPQVFLRYLRGGEFVTGVDVKEYLTLAAISVILIIIAAYIEANITPKIAERFLL